MIKELTTPHLDEQKTGARARNIRPPEPTTSELSSFGVTVAEHGKSGVLEEWLRFGAARPTGSDLNCFVSSQRAQEWTASPAAIPEMLGAVRAAFGLNTSDLARALRVQRPTVYAWLEESAIPHPRRLLRLAELARIASRWLRFCGEPIGDRARRITLGGRTFVQILASDPLRERLIYAALEAALKLPRAQSPDPLDALFANRGFGIPARVTDDEFNRISGKRIDDE